MSRHAATVMVLALLGLPGMAGANTGALIQAHVEAVANTVAPHLPRAASPPPVQVVEKAAATAGVVDGRIEISTGLLAILSSDAELAMVLAYEQCRAVPVPHGRAAPATGWGPRRSSEAAARADDAAARDAMTAVVAAGWDGRAALEAWHRLVAATPTGGVAGAYGDGKANTRRCEAATKSLAATGQRAKRGTGFAVGTQSYREEVTSRLMGHRIAMAAPHERVLDMTPIPPAAGRAEPWLVYRRSGGFTGWTAELRVFADGARWVSESRKKDEEGARARVEADMLDELRGLAKRALAAPPRQARSDAKYMRDGMLRSVELRTDSGWKSVSLSDTLRLTDDDHALLTRLEALLR